MKSAVLFDVGVIAAPAPWGDVVTEATAGAPVEATLIAVCRGNYERVGHWMTLSEIGAQLPWNRPR